MASLELPIAGPLSLQDVEDEFGGGGSKSLSEYYRNGIYVPDYAENTSVPESGEISLNDFYGTRSKLDTILDPGQAGSYYGFSTGWFQSPGPHGTLEDSDLDGITILELVSFDSGGSQYLSLSLQGFHAQTKFTTLTGTNLANLSFASAWSYDQHTANELGGGWPNANGTTWIWQVVGLWDWIVNGNNATVELIP